jgi:hypothetical protein
MVGSVQRRGGSRKPVPMNDSDMHRTKKRLLLLHRSKRCEPLPSMNRCTLLLLVCMMTDHFVLLAVAAAASTPMAVVDSTGGSCMPNIFPRRKLFWSVPFIPWARKPEISPVQDEDKHQHPFVNKSRYNKQWLSALIKNILSRQSLFGFHPRSTKFTFESVTKVRGGEVNNNSDEESDNELGNLELSDIDDDVPAEDLLDAIFDSNEMLHPPVMTPKASKLVQKKSYSGKSQEAKQQLEGSQNAKLQESVKTKDNVTADSKLVDNSKDVGVIDFEEIFGAVKNSKARSCSMQKMSTRIDKGSGPKLERINAGKTTDASSSSVNRKSTDSRSDRRREELGRLSKKPAPLSEQKSNQVDNKIAMPRRRTIDASPEAPRKRVQEIRAAPTVSTSGVTMKGASPAFLRRRAPSPSSKNAELRSPSASSRAHAVWGPHAQHLKTKPGPPTGPSRYKATEDERRAHENQSRIREERKKLLSNLAIKMNDLHTSVVKALIRGSAAHIPPELFGQTIMQEKSACNEKFYGSVSEVKSSFDEAAASGLESTVFGEEVDVATPSFRHIEDPTLLSYWGLTPHAKLYGVSLCGCTSCHYRILYSRFMFLGMTKGRTIPSCAQVLPSYVFNSASTSNYG